MLLLIPFLFVTSLLCTSPIYFNSHLHVPSVEVEETEETTEPFFSNNVTTTDHNVTTAGHNVATVDGIQQIDWQQQMKWAEQERVMREMVFCIEDWKFGGNLLLQNFEVYLNACSMHFLVSSYNFSMDFPVVYCNAILKL